MAELSGSLAFLSAILSILLAPLYYLCKPVKSRGLPLPPGPRPDFIIGNARHLAAKSPWLQYTAWKEKYGNIMHLEALGTHVIVLNSYKAMHDLLNSKPIYADRHTSMMADTLMGWGRFTTAAHYGETWKKHRKMMRPAFHKDAILAHSATLEKIARACLLELLHSPGGLREHLRYTGRPIVMFTYGLKVDGPKDPLIAVPEKAFATVIKVAMPGKVPLAEYLPFLRHIPSWFPGAGFKGNAKIWRKELDDMVEVPFSHVKANMATGVAIPSFTSKCLEESMHDGNDIMWNTGTMYMAGADTTHAILTSFILAMVLHPDVQKKAQAEIDGVIAAKGKGLPNFEDRGNLPYIECLLKDLQRWLPVLPLSVPRRLTEDDCYGGYFLPAGSIIFSNHWALSRDEAHYKDPERFWPERFENPETAELDPYKYAFGWGRRACAGMNFADAMLYLAVVSILAMFDISKPLDEHGNETEPEVVLGTGIVSAGLTYGIPGRTEGFKCTIRPRSDDAAKLIGAASEKMSW
ncbi:hypothetical protein BOTBODRAFT_167514 [Botryobasidium botryosum FD-172 SS1]|uniref:Cytochrome P450 n=1 Tax=Botryobasidium botryosum (strain FD-172 SS1) TaxID=930990 RepID=A0A067M508_BOTB1|nr:hypothetical protein BOTBODRAFT_167514 [Botryobasidium botryosum FD-172 SS1]